MSISTATHPAVPFTLSDGASVQGIAHGLGRLFHISQGTGRNPMAFHYSVVCLFLFLHVSLEWYELPDLKGISWVEERLCDFLYLCSVRVRICRINKVLALQAFCI